MYQYFKTLFICLLSIGLQAMDVSDLQEKKLNEKMAQAITLVDALKKATPKERKVLIDLFDKARFSELCTTECLLYKYNNLFPSSFLNNPDIKAFEFWIGILKAGKREMEMTLWVVLDTQVGDLVTIGRTAMSDYVEGKEKIATVPWEKWVKTWSLASQAMQE